MLFHEPEERKYEIDWQAFPSVVFESDDWGCCESAVSAKEADEIWKQLDRFGVCREIPVITTLESPAQLERLYQTLEKYRGADGVPAVFTAFVSLGNPDFEKIRANGFARYEDIGLDVGVPDGWERGDVVGKIREGFKRGVFHPEFHTVLHHTGPVMWLQRLREDSDRGRLARALFDLGCYSQGGEHLPEYYGMNVREQYQWAKTGIERFKRVFNRAPEAGITSDAFPETEIVWSALGINTVCLKNCRTNYGETVVNANKPWNMQNVYSKIGDYNAKKDLVYLTRNVFFEAGMAPGWYDTAQDALARVRINGEKFNEPSVISTHRINYASLDEKLMDERFSELEKLLDALCRMKMHFLTTIELSQLYRQGWSSRAAGGKTIFRKWHQDARITDSAHAGRIESLTGGKVAATADLAELPLGSYLLH